MTRRDSACSSTRWPEPGDSTSRPSISTLAPVEIVGRMASTPGRSAGTTAWSAAGVEPSLTATKCTFFDPRRVRTQPRTV
jgi:hypothetical protein